MGFLGSHGGLIGGPPNHSCMDILIYKDILQMIGGEGGIRTHGTLARTPDFESGPFGHSGTSPGTVDLHRNADRAF